MAKKYGKWIVRETLSEGGQAHTFIVCNENDVSQEKYVLKRLKNRNRIERFISEIENTRKIEHSYVVKIIDFSPYAENPYLVTPYYSGGTLENINIESFPLKKKLELFQKICEGIHSGHGLGIIHRDIKPSNIFIAANGDPIVGDWGICHVIDGERFTITDEAVGPFRFMAPELEDGRADKVGPVCDIYSLGKLFYWILSGKTFAREKHRDSIYDLTRLFNNPAYHLIYELLDKMIVNAPDSRLSNTKLLIEELNLLNRRIDMNAHAIGPNIPQLCSYCGKGEYQNVIGNNQGMDVHNFGFQPVGGAKWIILVCDYCGNTQIFRPDKIKRNNPWETHQ
jgi:serine/threonine protein kinase